MSDDGSTVATQGPISARRVRATGYRPSVRCRTSENVVLIGGVAASLDGLTFLGECGLLVDVVVRAVKIVDALRYDDALGVLPGTATDAISCVHCRCAGSCSGTEVCVPRHAACTCCRGEILAM